MDREPRRLISRIVEYAFLFALSCFLVKYGVSVIKEVWWILAIIAAVIIAIIVIYRILKHKHDIKL